MRKEGGGEVNQTSFQVLKSGQYVSKRGFFFVFFLFFFCFSLFSCERSGKGILFGFYFLFSLFSYQTHTNTNKTAGKAELTTDKGVPLDINTKASVWFTFKEGKKGPQPFYLKGDFICSGLVLVLFGFCLVWFGFVWFGCGCWWCSFFFF